MHVTHVCKTSWNDWSIRVVIVRKTTRGRTAFVVNLKPMRSFEKYSPYLVCPSLCTHCYFTRLNLKKMGSTSPCVPALLRIFVILWGIFVIIQFILSDKHLDRAGWSLRHNLNKVKQWHLHSTSNEAIWLKKIQITCRGKKVPFGQHSYYFGFLWLLSNTVRQNLSDPIF